MAVAGAWRHARAPGMSLVGDVVHRQGLPGGQVVPQYVGKHPGQDFSFQQGDQSRGCQGDDGEGPHHRPRSPRPGPCPGTSRDRRRHRNTRLSRHPARPRRRQRAGIPAMRPRYHPSRPATWSPPRRPGNTPPDARAPGHPQRHRSAPIGIAAAASRRCDRSPPAVGAAPRTGIDTRQKREPSPPGG